jgi:tetratricopeptide (TPR) repeat protein
MEELTHSLSEDGSIQKRDQKFILAGKLSEIQVPDTIQGIIASRMDRLEENLKRLLQVASVIGREFFFRILQSITGMREELKSHLLNLQGLEFIYEKRLFPELEYIFKHALTQEVAYNSLLLKRRKEIHERIGEAMEGLFADHLEEFYEMLAYHYARSENHRKACQYLKYAGNKAMRNNSLWEAFRFHERALGIVSAQPATDENKREHMEVVLSMATPMRLLVYPEGSLEILQEAERVGTELGDPKSLAAIYSWIGLYHVQNGAPFLARQYQENAFQQAEKGGDVDLIAPTAFDLCLSFFSTGEWRRAVDTIPNAISLIEKTGKQSEFFGRPFNVYPILEGLQGFCLAMQGDFEEGFRLLEKALSFARHIGHLFTVGTLHLMVGMLYVWRGEGESAIEHIQHSLKYYEESRVMLYVPYAWTYLGRAHYLLGDMENAQKHVEKGLKIQRDLGTMFWFSIHPFCLAMVRFALGDASRAKDLAEEAVKISEKIRSKTMEGLSRALLGRIIGKTDPLQGHEAEEMILRGIKTLNEIKQRPSSAVGYLYLGELYADTARTQEALENLKKAKSMFQEMHMDYWLAKTQEVLARL